MPEERGRWRVTFEDQASTSGHNFVVERKQIVGPPGLSLVALKDSVRVIGASLEIYVSYNIS